MEPNPQEAQDQDHAQECRQYKSTPGVSSDECSSVATAKFAEVDGGSELLELVGEEDQCSDIEVGLLSSASTDSGPPSPGHQSLQCSPAIGPADSPWQGPASASGAGVATNTSGTPGFADLPSPQLLSQSKEKLYGSLPEYRIHSEGEPHTQCQPVLRVRDTFVEYWEPEPLSAPRVRRSHSTPASMISLAASPQEAPRDPAAFGNQWLQDCVPPPGMFPPPGSSPTLLPSSQTNAPPPPPAFDLGASASASQFDASEAGETPSTSDNEGEQPTYWQHPAATVPMYPGGSQCVTASNEWFYEVPMVWGNTPPSATGMPWMPSQSSDPMTAQATNWNYGPMQQQQQPQQGQLSTGDSKMYSVPQQRPVAEQAQAQFYSLSHALQIQQGQQATAWVQERHGNDSVGHDVPNEKNEDRMESPTRRNSEGSLPTRLLPEARQEGRPRANTTGDLNHNSGRDSPQSQSARKGCTIRKTPIPDEKWAHQIIEKARVALAESRQETSIWELSHQNKHTSSNVQDAMAITAKRGWSSDTEQGWHDAWAMVACFQGRIRQAYESPFANFVLSKIFEVMPTTIVGFVAGELKDGAEEAAKHRFGCRCMVRLIRFHAQAGAEIETVSQVINEVVAKAEPLGLTQFGTHVVQELADSGLPEHRHMVFCALRGHFHRCSRNRFACRVVERLIVKCCPSDVHAMMDELLGSKDSARQLVVHEFGARVVRAFLNGQYAERAAENLCAVSAEIVSSRSGRLLLQDAHAIAARSSHRMHSR